MKTPFDHDSTRRKECRGKYSEGWGWPYLEINILEMLKMKKKSSIGKKINKSTLYFAKIGIKYRC